jgi:hypothetical protein
VDYRISYLLGGRSGHCSRAAPRQFDQARHPTRHLFESFFFKLKRSRGIATGYDKTARNSSPRSTSPPLLSGLFDDTP